MLPCIYRQNKTLTQSFLYQASLLKDRGKLESAMVRNLCIAFFLASASINVLARKELQSPQYPIRRVMKVKKTKMNANILDFIRKPLRPKEGFEGSNSILRKVDLPGNGNPKNFKTINLLGFPLKIAQEVLLMNSERLVAESCRASFYNQTIHSKGCISKTVQVKHCNGKCNSFYVPMGNSAFRFCSNCLPEKSKILVITLICPATLVGFKMVAIRNIESCACQSIKSCSS